MLPVRNLLVKSPIQSVPIVTVNKKETADTYNHLKVLGVKEMKPFIPKPKEVVDFDDTVKQANEAIEKAKVYKPSHKSPSEFALKIQESMKKTAQEEVNQHLEAGREVTGILNNEVVKVKKKSIKNNTEAFLEELHTLMESWAPQNNTWEGERRPILYDFECREELRKLMNKHGL